MEIKSKRPAEGGDLDRAQRETSESSVGDRDRGVQSGLSFKTAAEITPERVSWQWAGRLPKAKLVCLDGPPGVGKSTITVDVTARLTRVDAEMPDKTYGPRNAMTVCLIGGEDGQADTIVPRLKAAGADLNRVIFPDFKDDVGPRGFRLDDQSPDVARLTQLVDRENVSLVVIDPLMAHLGSEVNSYRDQDIRRALARLTSLTDLGCTVLFVRHLTKGATSAVYGGGGSIGITGACRVVWTVGKQDDGTCVLAQAKNNLAQIPPSLGYRIVEDHEGVCGRIEWLGEVSTTADDLVIVDRDERHEWSSASALEDAQDYIRQALENGPIPSRELQEGAAENGISERTLKRARKALGVLRQKGVSGWRVYLPQADQPPPLSPDGTLGLVANSAPEPALETRLPSGPRGPTHGQRGAS